MNEKLNFNEFEDPNTFDEKVEAMSDEEFEMAENDPPQGGGHGGIIASNDPPQDGGHGGKAFDNRNIKV